ncbi:E3 binding domain-containing protein [Marinithermus hydrothermalis]|uniref:E3 binding domain protein n=1 Tax=Marinithermus hydrothermalis (strain DSM 14884 / JCM 11576 / T1) TaxID=869210 RepID=F2NLS0_MARHT|nr:E3 binding domain-containing protein [Marinithermus hydrothermalis]AEB10900.1 E3 binding domain protein [Marinithermus hydrothermalis DSM 14884]
MTEPKITPLARRLAEENGINWRELKGTGPDGTIVERDILAYLAKVMAGEVDLPPAPAEAAAPPAEVPDLSAAQAALAKEGLNLDDLVPTSSQDSPAPEDTTWEFELDLDDLESPPEEEALTWAEASPEPAPPPAESSPEEALTWPDPPQMPDLDALTPEEEPARTPPDAGTASEEERPPVEAKEPLEASVEDAPPVLAPEATPGAEHLTWEDVPSPVLGPDEAALETAPPLPETAPALAAAGTEGEDEAVDLELEDATVAPVPVPTPTASGATATLGPVYRRVVSLEAAAAAARDLAEAWGVRVPLLLFVYRAAACALEELGASLPPVVGSYEEGRVRAYAVPPATGLKATLEALQEACEPGEGLAVLSLEATALDEVVLPGTPLLTLGRAGLPEGLGLLSLSEYPAEEAERLLERVAYYLERPILLA